MYVNLTLIPVINDDFLPKNQQACNVAKKGLHRRCYPVKFRKVFMTSFLKDHFRVTAFKYVIVIQSSIKTKGNNSDSYNCVVLYDMIMTRSS